MKILVTGAKGQLGTEMMVRAEASRHTYVFTDVLEDAAKGILQLDITDPNAIPADVDVIINCAAYTDVNRAESDEQTAMKVNALAPALLAKAAKASGKTFKEMGVDYVVSGGQSMNPSTEDFINGFDTLNAENIIVFPNNKNIILAAKQAAKIYKESKVWVVETKTISQGFSALTMLDLNGEPEDILKEMSEVISNVISGSITYSIRNTNIEGIDVHKDDFIAILDGKIVSSNRKRIDAVKGLLKAKDISNKDIVTIIYGEGVNQKEINEVVKHIERNYSNLEVEVIEGNQEVYSYILVIE